MESSSRFVGMLHNVKNSRQMQAETFRNNAKMYFERLVKTIIVLRQRFSGKKNYKLFKNRKTMF